MIPPWAQARIAQEVEQALARAWETHDPAFYALG
jgi:hypothetical protein